MTKIDIKHLAKKEIWQTPADLFLSLNKEFNFTLDPCCLPENAKCKTYFTKKENGLLQSWAGHTVFMNPPYGRELKHWIIKAHNEFKEHNITIVGLIPADKSDTSYFWEHIYNIAEIRYLKGRLKFKGVNSKGKLISNNPAPFPSMLVIWKAVK